MCGVALSPLNPTACAWCSMGSCMSSSRTCYGPFHTKDSTCGHVGHCPSKKKAPLSGSESQQTRRKSPIPVPPFPDLAGKQGTPVSRFGRDRESGSRFGGPGISWPGSASQAAKILSHLGRWDRKFSHPTFFEVGGIKDFPIPVPSRQVG